MINPFINRTENRLSKTELVKTILMTISGIAIARMILVFFFVFLMLFTLFLTSIGYYSNEENLGRCARFLFKINQCGSDIIKRFNSLCCKTKPSNDTKFHEMSKIRRCLLFMVQVYARCIMYLLGYLWIKEKFPENKHWFVFPSYMERIDAAKICLANHVSFVDSLYFLSRCVPRSVVIQANVVKPFKWALNAFSPIVVPVTEKQRLKSKPTKDLIHENLESNILKRPLIIFPEGGTTEARTLINFQDGAFCDLQPVQPIALKYHYKWFDPSWTNDIGPFWLLYRMCCQFVNHLHVEYYDIVKPDFSDVENPDIIENDALKQHVSNVICSEDKTIIEMNYNIYDKENKYCEEIKIDDFATQNIETAKSSTGNDKISDITENIKSKHDLLVQQFKSKVLRYYLNDPFFIQTKYSIRDSRMTSKLKAKNKIPIEYVCEHIMDNGNYGITKICNQMSIGYSQLEKIIVKIYNCNNTNATLNRTQFHEIMKKSHANINKFFDETKTNTDCITFKDMIDSLQTINF